MLAIECAIDVEFSKLFLQHANLDDASGAAFECRSAR
jgi:hypothetical protein